MLREAGRTAPSISHKFRVLVTKQRRRKRFYRLLLLITRLHRILKRFSWNSGISFNSNLDLHILQEGKITEERCSSRKSSFDHVAIIKTCKQRSTFKRFVFKSEGIYIWPSASNTLSLRSRICYRNSTEQTKLAPDHLLTAPSFSLGTFQLIIYSERRSWEKQIAEEHSLHLTDLRGCATH